MKKRWFAGVALAGAMAMALCACGGTESGSGGLQSAEEFYGLGAVTTVRLLGSEVSGQAIQSLASVAAAAETVPETPAQGTEEQTPVQPADPAKEQAEAFNEYFNMLDCFLGEDRISTTVEENADEGYAAYEYKMTITGMDLSGDAVTHVMYYTETERTDRDDRDDDDWGEEEHEYRLEGVLVSDGAEYLMRGERKEEREWDETESEISIRAYLDDADMGTFVSLEHEVSEEEDEKETEYVYKVYRGGRLVEETSVEFETEREHGEEETEFELEFRQGDARGKYSVSREREGGSTVIKVEYEIDGKRGEFRIRERTSASGEPVYEYTYADGSKEEHRSRYGRR